VTAGAGTFVLSKRGDHLRRSSGRGVLSLGGLATGTGLGASLRRSVLSPGHLGIPDVPPAFGVVMREDLAMQNVSRNLAFLSTQHRARKGVYLDPVGEEGEGGLMTGQFRWRQATKCSCPAKKKTEKRPAKYPGKYGPRLSRRRSVPGGMGPSCSRQWGRQKGTGSNVKAIRVTTPRSKKGFRSWQNKKYPQTIIVALGS